MPRIDKSKSGPILIVSTALSGGGAEAVARLMVEEIEGIECLLFENDAGIQVAGRKVRAMSKIRHRGVLGKFLVNVWRVIFIQYTKLRIRPQVTVSHLEGPNFANVLTICGGCRVLFVHNRVSQNYQQGRLVDRAKIVLVRQLYRRADRVFCVSSDICAELIIDFDVPSDRVEILPNPIDIGWVNENSYRTYGDARDSLCEQRYLVSVASLTLQKNHELLLRVFSKLVRDGEEYSDLKLVLVGEGKERQQLQSLCSDLDLRIAQYGMDDFDLSAQVFFMGFQSNPYPLLRHARLFLMPSLWEGLPIALLEAMALGTPTIAANCSAGVRDIFLQNTSPLSSKSADYERTPLGVFVYNTPCAEQVSSIQLWAELIRDMLSDCQYLEECSQNTTSRVKQNDVHTLSRIWRERLSLGS